MTQYDRIVSGKATQEQIQAEIAASFASKPLYRRTPGHVLAEEFLAPYYADLGDLSARARIPLKALRNLVRGTGRIDNFMADRLGAFYRNGSTFWLDLQERFDRGEAL